MTTSIDQAEACLLAQLPLHCMSSANLSGMLDDPADIVCWFSLLGEDLGAAFTDRWAFLPEPAAVPTDRAVRKFSGDLIEMLHAPDGDLAGIVLEVSTALAATTSETEDLRGCQRCSSLKDFIRDRLRAGCRHDSKSAGHYLRDADQNRLTRLRRRTGAQQLLASLRVVWPPVRVHIAECR